MRAWQTLSAALVAITGLLLGACGGSSAFNLTSDDNNPAKLQQAIALQAAPKVGPLNATGKPLAFVVASDPKKAKPSQLIAFDLDGEKALWTVEAAVESRILVGGEFIAHKAGGNIVARDVRSGSELWSKPVDGEFLGAAADLQRVYYVTKGGSKSKPLWYLVALDGRSGSELWRHGAQGSLGAPAARGGLVFSPFLKQWLAILDANTGKQVARIRGIDDEISFVRTNADGVYFGSNRGVFYLDERAASGKRAESTYGAAELPKEFVRQHYYWDAFDPVQAQYSAYDRNRILWRAQPADQRLAFASEQVVVHTYRFFFGFDAGSGQLQWAYNHPRHDVVASAHVGPVVAFASRYGGVGALDPSSGRRTFEATIDLGGRVIDGATFDAEGWQPSDEVGEPPTNTVEALASIARDPDARFNDVKRFAIAALATIPGPEVARDLLALIQNERTPPKLHEKAVEVLVQRRDPQGVPHLLEALTVEYDYISGSRPRAVGVVAQALAAIDPAAVEPSHRGQAVELLQEHLNAPETPARDLAHVVRALGSLGGEGARAPLRSFLLTYRTSPEFSGQIAPLSAAIDALLARGDAGERELVAFVAEDSRTVPSVADYAQRALLQTQPGSAGEAGEKAGGPAGAAAPAKR